MGTGSGHTFTVRDADPHHWCVLTVWESDESRQAFTASPIWRSWDRISNQHALFDLTPMSSRGLWNNKEPFGQPQPRQHVGLHAALTRARIKPQWWREFWRSVPPVSKDVNNSAGLVCALGIGEAPIGLQGTFSVWVDNDSITQFATHQKAHASVIKRTHETGWYSEELFARFHITRASGRYQSLDLESL